MVFGDAMLLLLFHQSALVPQLLLRLAGDLRIGRNLDRFLERGLRGRRVVQLLFCPAQLVKGLRRMWVELDRAQVTVLGPEVIALAPVEIAYLDVALRLQRVENELLLRIRLVFFRRVAVRVVPLVGGLAAVLILR